jgi:hypothetical protein
VGAPALAEVLSHVAVGAENLNLGRVAVLPQPDQESMSTTATTDAAIVLDALPHPTPVNVVEDQERVLALTAACASSPVGVHRNGPEVQVPLATTHVPLFPVGPPVLLDFGDVGVVVGPARSLSALLAGRVQAPPVPVELSLWLCFAALGTVAHVEDTTGAEAWTRALEIQRG